MRNLCLALILANVAFAVWQYGRAGRDATPARAQRDVPRIMLVSEDLPGAESRANAAARDRGAQNPSRESAPAPDRATSASGTPEDGADPSAEGSPVAEGAADPSAEGSPAAEGAVEGLAAGAEPDPADTAQAALRCRSIGPFEELSQATAAAAALRADGFEPSQRAAEGEVWVGYWVYIDAIPTTAEAESMLAALGEAGIPEAYLISGDADNTISLGVFTELARAQRLSEDVRELGYDPVVTDRTRQGNVYWVDVRLAPDAALDVESLQPAGRIVRLEQQPCP